MKVFKRDMAEILLGYTQFPAIVVQGPRQAGKTVLVQEVFKNHIYTSFEDPDTRSLAHDDPRQFLKIYENKAGIIIDEFQYVPEILSYLQLEIDAKDRPGYFVLTGSQNFLMNAAITQSLAGRVGILTMLPLSLHELTENDLLSGDADQVILNGGYPRLYDKKIDATKLYPSYINTYLERDVRQIINVGDLRLFQRFLQLCAGRVGQQLNVSQLASDCGISSPTAHRWISLLESSYIIFLLPPYYKNFNKRVTKSPKLYFYDTGVVCSLLGVESTEVLAQHPFRGGIFESFIIADLCKQYFNMGKRPPIYYWRDLNDRLEVDCVIEEGLSLFPIEIKSGSTVASDYFSALEKWSELAQADPDKRYVIYNGDLVQERGKGHLMGWSSAGDLVEKIKKRTA